LSHAAHRRFEVIEEERRLLGIPAQLSGRYHAGGSDQRHAAAVVLARSPRGSDDLARVLAGDDVRPGVAARAAKRIG
jgi:hypothetical protein